MTVQLHALSLDANDPPLLAAFWSGVLQRDVLEETDGTLALRPDDDGGFPIRFRPAPNRKWGPNQLHFDLTSTSLADQEGIVARALRLGGRHLDVGQTPDEDHVALSSDGLAEVGYFWSRALDWPLVWDQDGETAIQSPRGGTKITWGGPPVAAKLGKNRFHFDVMPPAGRDQRAAVEQLVTLGAKPIDIGQDDVNWAVLADPGGNEFCVLTPRQQ